MSAANHPDFKKRKSMKAITISIIVIAILIITVVLPAKYGIDPTGAGKLFGYGKSTIPKDSLAIVAGAETTVKKTFPLIKLEELGSEARIKRPVEANNLPPKKQFHEREDSTQVSVPAGKGIEFKVTMLKHGSMKYEWTTNKGILYSDFHGEVKQVTPPGKDEYYESYTIAYSNNMAGTFLSPFEGRHGWYFRNKGSEDVIVTIRLKGQYSL